MRIKVNGFEADIVRVPTRDKGLIDASGEYALGTQSWRMGIIYIDESLDYPLMAKVVRHELTHLFIYAHLLEIKDSYKEEELCEFVALYSAEINRIANEFMGGKNE